MNSHDKEIAPKMRFSKCAALSREQELARLRRMSVEERIKAALSMGARFACFKPTATHK